LEFFKHFFQHNAYKIFNGYYNIDVFSLVLKNSVNFKKYGLGGFIAWLIASLISLTYLTINLYLDLNSSAVKLKIEINVNKHQKRKTEYKKRKIFTKISKNECVFKVQIFSQLKDHYL
jgi:hypothetical protein